MPCLVVAGGDIHQSKSVLPEQKSLPDTGASLQAQNLQILAQEWGLVRIFPGLGHTILALSPNTQSCGSLLFAQS